MSASSNDDTVLIEFHPLAEIFPLIEGDELTELANDIKENGLLDPIILLDGQILDGRNRYRACIQAEVSPEFHCYGSSDLYDDLALTASVRVLGDLRDPVALVVSRNIKRRHLNQSQRAMAAARALEWYEKQAHERQVSSLLQGDESPLAPFGANGITPSETKGKATYQAGQDFGVSGRSVERAKKVLDDGAPEVVQAVDAGKAKVTKAAEVAALPEEKQGQALTEAQAKPKKTKPAQPASSKQSETDKLKARISDLEQLVSDLQDVNQELTDEQRSIVDLTSDEKALQRKLNELRQHIRALEVKRNELQNKVLLLQRENKALRNRLGEKS